MTRKLRSAAIALACLLGVEQAHAQMTKLSMISQGDPKPYAEIVEAFEKSNPDIDIEMQAPGRTYEEILQRSLRGALVGDVPDLVFQGYNVMRAAVDKDLPVELTSFLGDETDLKAAGYDAAQFDACSIRGKVYGLPFATSLPIFYYNADLVREAGGDPDRFPATWPDLVALAKKINTLGGQTAGIYFRYAHSGNFSFQAMVTSQGGRMMTPDDKMLAFTGKEGLLALQLLRDFADAGMIDMTADQARQAFTAGTIGIFADSSSFLNSMTEQVAGRFDFRTAAYPLDAEKGKLPPGGNCVIMQSKDEARQEAAWRFIKFATGMEGQTMLARSSGYVPNNRLAMEDPDLLGNFYKQNPNFLVAANLIPRLTQFYEFPGENSVKISDVIQNHLQSVVTGKEMPDQALSAMKSDVEALLPK